MRDNAVTAPLGIGSGSFAMMLRSSADVIRVHGFPAPWGAMWTKELSARPIRAPCITCPGHQQPGGCAWL